MRVYSFNENKFIHTKKNWFHENDDFFVICNPKEIVHMQPVFNFDQGTIMECINLDENVRFECFANYDFISLIYFYMENNQVINSEINIYVSKNYILLVLQDDEKVTKDFAQSLDITKKTAYVVDGLSSIQYRIFHKILNDLSNALEAFEDLISDVELKIINHVEENLLYDIMNIKATANTIKKQLRPMLYIGDQFLLNENNFIPADKIKYFRTLDIRMNKLYDFSVNLHEKTEQLIYLYDSKINMLTNETITKLTILTIFFGPLTVITGIYGMNFMHMPELDDKYSYPIVLAVMVLISLTIYLYFKRKKLL